MFAFINLLRILSDDVGWSSHSANLTILFYCYWYSVLADSISSARIFSHWSNSYGRGKPKSNAWTWHYILLKQEIHLSGSLMVHLHTCTSKHTLHCRFECRLNMKFIQHYSWIIYYILINTLFVFKGQGIGDVTISAGEGLTATTTVEGVYVLNNVTAGGYTIQVGNHEKF